MRLSYSKIAGQSVERLAALSDGIFAVAMTLLVLDLHTPAMEAIHSERDLWHALAALGPQLVMYLMRFFDAGNFLGGTADAVKPPVAWAQEPGVDSRESRLARGSYGGDSAAILIAQGMYAFGAALCVISPELSVAFIVIVQLYYAIAPRIWRRKQAVRS